MAQQFPTSAQVIYQTLATDPTFVGFLGTYTFKGNNGVTTPAISIVTPGQSLPELRNVEGVECVIQDVGNTKRKDYVTGDSDFQITFEMFLVAWEDASGTDLQNATLRAMQIFGGASSFETVATANGLGSLVQTLVRIPSDKPILA